MLQRCLQTPPLRLAFYTNSKTAWIERNLLPQQQLREATVVAATAAAQYSSTAASNSSDLHSSSSSSGGRNMQPGAAFLASLVDYERIGVPAAAGVAGSSSSSSSSSSGSRGFDLKKMHNLLAAMGDPHKRLKVVHVAGTKGKGSVVTLLSNILLHSGYKVGSYTSPHMFDIRERILVGGGGAAAAAAAAAVPVSGQQWEQLAAAAAAAVQDTEGTTDSSSSSRPSHFEAVTAMAFKHFADSKVDIAVVETGLGGATDATNVWNHKNNTDKQLQLSVITAIGRDHVDALGGSISSITRAKAGIMKTGVPVVTGPQRASHLQQQQQQQQQQCDHDVIWGVLHEVADQLQCPVIEAEQTVQACPTEGSPPITVLPGDGTNLARQSLNIQASLLPPQQQQQQQQQAAAVLDLPAVSVQLVGGHQVSNVQTAAAAALLLQQQGWEKITADAIRKGLETAWLPGRFQVVKLPGNPHHIVLDGAHTGDSAAALAAAVRAAFPEQPLVLLLAMAADKQHREMCESLRACRPNVVIFTSVPIAGSTHRAAPPGTLAAHWQAAAILSSGSSRPYRCRELIQANLGAALEKARHELGGFGGKGVVVVTGSLHAVAAAMKQLEIAQ